MGVEISGTAGVPTVLDEGIVVVVRFLVRLVLLDIRLLNQLLLFFKGISLGRILGCGLGIGIGVVVAIDEHSLALGLGWGLQGGYRGRGGNGRGRR